MHEFTSDIGSHQPELSSSGDDWEERQNCGKVGSESSNTDPTNPHVLFNSSVKCHANGCDWMSLNGFSQQELPHELNDYLESRKRLAKQHPDKPVTVEIDGLQWTLDSRPFGKGLNHFEYQLRGGFLRVGISSQTASAAPRAFIEAPGRFCGGKCPRELLKVLKSIIRGFGIDIHRHKFTRLDMHADCSGIPAPLLYALYREGKVITRAGKVKEENVRGCITGSTFASAGSLMLRWYDKNKELNADPVRIEEYLARVGLDKLPEQNTRVEIQIGSDYMRTRGVGTTDEMMDSLGLILNEIMTNWIRVVDKQVSKHNSQRQMPAAWWGHLTDALCGGVNGFNQVSREPSKSPSFESSESLLVSAVSSYLEKFGVSFSTMVEALAFISKNVSPSLDRRQQDATETKVLKRSQIENEQRIWNERRHLPEFG